MLLQVQSLLGSHRSQMLLCQQLCYPSLLLKSAQLRQVSLRILLFCELPTEYAHASALILLVAPALLRSTLSSCTGPPHDEIL